MKCYTAVEHKDIECIEFTDAYRGFRNCLVTMFDLVEETPGVYYGVNDLELFKKVLAKLPCDIAKCITIDARTFKIGFIPFI